MAADESHDDRTQTHVILTKGTMVSHYRIVEKIGAGGMGEVYLAEDTILKRQAALKFLPSHFSSDPSVKQRFAREAQAVARISHPNIVQIYEAAEHNGRPFIAMELVKGQTLREVIKGQGLDIKEAIVLMLRLCEGLHNAHQLGIIHRDIKPANIKVDANGQPKLLDFGLAAMAGGDKVTRSGTTLGTVGYMSPEQASGHRCDERSDLFSLGVVLYEMLAGCRPFKGEDEASVLIAVTLDTPEPLARYSASVPDDLQRIVTKLLHKDPGLRYQSAAGVVSDLRLLQSDSFSDYSQKSISRYGGRKKHWMVGLALAAAAVALAIVTPWRSIFFDEFPVTTAENRLAILYFENKADPGDSLKLGETITNLLITDLSESSQLQVVSEQRLFDINRSLGNGEANPLGREDATQIARKARARWMLTGSVLQVEPDIVLTAHLADVASGDMIATQRIVGQRGEALFALVDRLTVEIKKDLALPLPARQEEDRLIADVTTHSLEAYRNYVDGLRYIHKYYRIDGLESFRKAIAIDSTFGMACYRLAISAVGAEQAQMIARAVRQLGKVSRKEAYYIRSLDASLAGRSDEAQALLLEIIKRFPDEKEAYHGLGALLWQQQKPEEAIPYLIQAIELDSLYRQAYNMLAYAYNDIDDFEQSIWAVNMYVSIAPDEANPYDTRGDLYAWWGYIDKAIASYLNSIEIKPDLPFTMEKLGHMYLFKRDYDSAKRWYMSFFTSPDKGMRAKGRLLLALIPLHQGKLRDGLNILDDGIKADRLEQAATYYTVNKHFLKATVYQELGESARALNEMEIILDLWHQLNPNDNISWRDYYVQLLLENNQPERARAAVTSLEQMGTGDMGSGWSYRLSYAIGMIQFHEGNIEEAIVQFQTAAQLTNRSNAKLTLAYALLSVADLGGAVNTYEEYLTSYTRDRAYWIVWSIRAQYYLAQAYERSGWTTKAVEQYEEFLKNWGEADEGLESVLDARTRLHHLKSGS